MTNQYSENKIKDMVLLSHRFNRWLVVKDAGFVPHGEHIWECLCDCGKRRKVTAEQLIHGRSKSCGCYQKDRTRELFSYSPEVIRVNRILLDYQSRAKEKSLSFALTKEQFKDLMDSDCYYCGGEPKNSFLQHGKPISVYQGIDRLDNTKGYTPDNVVPCCIRCNKMKKVLSHDEFVTHILKIASRFEVESPQADIYSEVCGGQLISSL